MLFAFFPVCNLVLFSSAYLGIRNLTEQAVQSIAMSDSRKQAAETEKSVLANYENPLLTLFHRVQITPADTLQIAVDKGGSQLDTYNIADALPTNTRPDYGANKEKLLYFYKLQVSCKVNPILNLSALPFIGLIPIIGGPSEITIGAQAPVENLDALNR
jgi:hypothetical protein